MIETDQKIISCILWLKLSVELVPFNNYSPCSKSESASLNLNIRPH